VGIAVPIILGSDGHAEPSLRREPSLTRALGDALFGRRFASRPGWLSEMVWDRDAYHRPHRVDWATGAAAMVSAACDAAVGDWDARFFLYSEEVDHAARARDAGFTIEFVPAARVCHRAGGSGSCDALVALLAVNRIRYMEKRGRNTGAYRMTVALHELLRAFNPGHRLALKMVMRRSSWASLPSATAPEPLRDEEDGAERIHIRQVTLLPSPSQGWSNP
jgi:GT2 family glycosyltransferase